MSKRELSANEDKFAKMEDALVTHKFVLGYAKEDTTVLTILVCLMR